MNTLTAAIKGGPMAIGDAITETLKIDLVGGGYLGSKFDRFVWLNRLWDSRSAGMEINAAMKGRSEVRDRCRAFVGDADDGRCFSAGGKDQFVWYGHGELRIGLWIAIFLERGHEPGDIVQDEAG